MSQYLDFKKHPWLSIDGKALGCTVVNKHGSKQNFQSIVSLFSKELGVVIYSTEKGAIIYGRI